ncbi:MAG: hypothetical protein AAF968_01755 [Pseudomonadota bacterium]
MRTIHLAAPLLAALATGALAAETVGSGGRAINEFPEGSVSREDGLENWGKFYEVASHPRCANCHVGPDNLPMWSGPSYGETRPHGMSINAGESRIGAEALVCSTCHTTLSEPRPGANDIPHSPPKVAMAWALAPVEAAWFGKSSSYICNQLKDPARNGGRNIREVAEHLDHDLILHWAWEPGGTREPAPYSLQESMDFLMMWQAAGLPCPSE